MSSHPGRPVAVVAASPERTSAQALGREQEVRATFDLLEDRLKERGLEFGDVAKMRIFYKDQAQVPVLNQVREQVFRPAFLNGDFPAATGVMVADAADTPPLQLEAFASRERSVFNSSQVYHRYQNVSPAPAYSHVARYGGLAAISGQTGLNITGTTISKDLASQTRQVMDNLLTLLQEIDLAISEVLRFNVYVSRPEDIGPVRGILGSVLPENQVRAGITAFIVAPPALREVDVEIEAFAVAGNDPTTAVAGPAFVTRRGDWIMAAAEAPLTSREDPVAQLGDLLTDMETAGQELGSSSDQVIQCTVWSSDPDSIGVLQSELRSPGNLPGLVDSAACLALPMVTSETSDGRLVIELTSLAP